VCDRYGVENIDRRFAHVPIVKKPVQRHVLQRIFVRAGGGDPATLRNATAAAASAAPRPRAGRDRSIVGASYILDSEISIGPWRTC
jgi:hypothetical protein